MLTLYYGPGACSMASHIVLEESGEKYNPKRMDLAKGEQRTPEYLKMNPQGRVPLLQLDNGEPLAENTAILPYLGKRFSLWPTDATAEAKALSLVGFFASSVHPAHGHVAARPARRRGHQDGHDGGERQGLGVPHPGRALVQIRDLSKFFAASLGLMVRSARSARLEPWGCD